jgi:hypothetical protein
MENFQKIDKIFEDTVGKAGGATAEFMKQNAGIRRVSMHYSIAVSKAIQNAKLTLQILTAGAENADLKDLLTEVGKASHCALFDKTDDAYQAAVLLHDNVHDNCMLTKEQVDACRAKLRKSVEAIMTYDMTLAYIGDKLQASKESEPAAVAQN